MSGTFNCRRTVRIIVADHAGLVLGVIVIIIRKKHIWPNLFCRIVIKILFLLLIGTLWIMVSRLQYATLVLDRVFLAIIIPLLCYRKENKCRDGYCGLFSSSLEGMRYRGRCAVLLAYAVILHLVLFTTFSSSLAAFTLYTVQEQNKETAYQPIKLPRFTVDPNDYQKMLSMFETEELGQIEPIEWLPMVEPEDIPKVLSVLEQRRAKYPNFQRHLSPPSMPGMGFDCNRYYQDSLRRAVDCCGRDVLPYILPFLKDPNSNSVMILRGQFGDMTVKDCLIKLWRQELDSQKQANASNASDMLSSQCDILEALVCICPFSEGRQYVLEYASCVQNYLYEFLERGVMRHLNRQQKGEILDVLIPTLKENPSAAGSGLDLLKYNCDLDIVSKDWLWRQMLDCSNKQDKIDEFGDFDLSRKPYDYNISDKLLTECLNNKNEHLRAMGQHIWRKLNKPLDEQILQQWSKDSNFVIRANAALLKPDEIGATDPSAFVRLMRNLAKQN
jgi:hypothetical protein